MSELRKDPVVDRWVIIAPERAERFPPHIAAEQKAVCPFCPGNEAMTPPEIGAVREAKSARNGPDWSMRVVPNLFAALRVEVQPDHRDGLFEREAGVGAHEIVIETPQHDRDFADLSVDEMTAVLWMWSERLRDLSNDFRLLAPLVFRHRGIEAGATLPHPHSQILVLPVMPHHLQQELDASARLFHERGACVWCDVMGEEHEEKVRFLSTNAAAIAICPWASRVPFEARVLPLGHQSSFEHESRETLRGVAEVLRDTLRRIDIALERPPCSVVLHTSPLRSDDLGHFHWHIEVLPAISRTAGMTVSGCYINPVAPEEAAAVLKRVVLG